MTSDSFKSLSIYTTTGTIVSIVENLISVNILPRLNAIGNGEPSEEITEELLMYMESLLYTLSNV